MGWFDCVDRTVEYRSRLWGLWVVPVTGLCVVDQLDKCMAKGVEQSMTATVVNDGNNSLGGHFVVVGHLQG